MNCLVPATRNSHNRHYLQRRHNQTGSVGRNHKCNNVLRKRPKAHRRNQLDLIDLQTENSRRTLQSRLGFAMLPISGYLRTGLLWAMIPLTVFAGRPITGCTCTSGEYKFVCAAHVSHDGVPPAASPHPDKCEKACCQRDQSNPLDFRQTHDCPLSQESGKSGNSGCNPDIQTAVIVVAPVTVTIGNEHRAHFDFPLVEPVVGMSERTDGHVISHETGPPGDDLVIALRRLLV